MVRSNENMFGYTVLFSGSAEVEKLIILLLVYLWNFFQILDALHTMLIFRTVAIGYLMSLIIFIDMTITLNQNFIASYS